jgi:hypothetical protein
MKHNDVLRWLSSQGLALTGLGLAQIVVRSQVQFPSSNRTDWGAGLNSSARAVQGRANHLLGGFSESTE